MKGSVEMICAVLSVRRQVEKDVNSSVALDPEFKEGMIPGGRQSRQMWEPEVRGVEASGLRKRLRGRELGVRVSFIHARIPARRGVDFGHT